MAELIAVSIQCNIDEQQLSAYRREKADRCRQPDDRARCLCAGWALDQALMRVGLREQSVAIAEGEGGKPFLSEYPQWHFSLSHSGEWAICALSNTPIGVDVEQWQERDYLRLAQRCFSCEETAALQQASSGCRQELFFRFWTRKESLLKVTGTGLGGLTSVNENGYRFKEYPLKGYSLTVCTAGEFPDELIVIK